MQSPIIGALMWVALMHGVRFIALTMIKECRCGVFCITSILSTPKNVGTHAKQIMRVVDNCHRNSRENEE